MSLKIKAPAYKESNYERYRLELMAWREITDIPKEKQGIAIALSLPEETECSIREKIFDELSITQLKDEEGFETLIDFLDEKLKKEDIADSWDKFNDFEEFKRTDKMSIKDYISTFDQKYRKIAKLNMKLPSEILAFKLLKHANLNKDEHMIVLTGMDYSKKDSLYEQAKKSLHKFKGDQVSSCSNDKFKLDPTYLIENEDVLLAAGFIHQSKVNHNNSKPKFSKTQNFNYNKHNPSKKNKPTRSMNPKGTDGQYLTCICCGSFRHLIANCPHSWESVNNVTDDDEEEANIVLYTGGIKPKTNQLGVEALKCAVLDCACSSTVCGKKWFNDYITILSDTQKHNLKKFNSNKVFKFGGGEKLTSLGSYQLPANLAGKDIKINVDVVDSDIPLLLSLKAMKKAKIKLDLEQDSAEIFGQSTLLNHTTSGHYCVPIAPSEVTIESVNVVNLKTCSQKERYDTLLKLHRQFAHPSTNKLISLLQNANIWDDIYKNDLEQIRSTCELCIAYKPTPSRPVVSLPLANKFNQCVTMDLKQWDNKWILYLIDMWSRLTVAKFITRKKPQEVINVIMTNWVGAGYGIMDSILTDNGGEFTAHEIEEVASILNITVLTTAAESPFQNGLCERNHAVTDNMLLKLREDYPSTPLDVLLSWALSAKNSLQMWHGFSSYQLVFGQNPNLPNVMTENVPALHGTTSSEILASHLNVLHSARKAFIESESCERIRRALRNKIRTSEQIFQPGDLVFYKREGKERWLGPGKVMFQDGKVVFIRHGSSFVRVSPNRLLKNPPSFNEHTPYDSIQSLTNDNQQSEKPSQSETNINTHPFISETIQPTIQPDNTVNVAPSVSAQPDPLPEANHTDTQSNETISATDRPLSKTVNSNFDGNELNTIVTKSKSLPLPNKDDTVIYRLKPEGDWHEAKVTGRSGKATGLHSSWFNVKSIDNDEQYSIDFKNVEWKKQEDVNIAIIPKSCQKTPECNEAKQTELEKLKHFNTYKEVVDEGQFRISTTWVLCEKNNKVRARLVARGYEETTVTQNDSPTISKSVMRLFIAISVQNQWKIKTTDIKSAFLQGKQLTRDVYIQPPKEAEVKQGHIWKLKHCLYGLSEAARQFYDSVNEVLITLGCYQCKLDPALFIYRNNDKLSGIIALHVDDFLHAGDDQFQKNILQPFTKHFIAGKLDEGSFSYVGFQIMQDKQSVTISQSHYVKNIDEITVTPERSTQKNDKLSQAEESTYRSLVGQINWAVQGTRPDLAFEMVYLSTKFKNTIVNDLLQAIKSIRKLKATPSILRFPYLGPPKEWTLVLFTDAAHANLCDGASSMGGHILLLTGLNSDCCPLSWCANKIKRVVRSTIAAETLSLQEGLEDAIYHQELINGILQLPSKIPIVAYIDNRSVIEALDTTKQVDDKRLRIDISAIKESIKRNEIQTIKWCPGASQLANPLTKKGAQCNLLLDTIQKGKIKF